MHIKHQLYIETFKFKEQIKTNLVQTFSQKLVWPELLGWQPSEQLLIPPYPGKLLEQQQARRLFAYQKLRAANQSLLLAQNQILQTK